MSGSLASASMPLARPAAAAGTAAERRDSRGMALADIVAFTPQTIGEALDHMRRALAWFQHRDDYRAVFLHAYFIITKNVHEVIEEQGAAEDRLFRDPAWMSRLAGKFATLYFRSLATFDRDAARERAWKIAHGMALAKSSTVLQDMVLGINAHVGYDLAQAIAANIREHGDGADAGRLAARKHDHDQANRILIRSISEIWREIPRAYGGLLTWFDRLSLSLDRRLAREGLQRYRESVWWHSLELLAAASPGDVERVLETMDQEATRIAEVVTGRRSRLLDPVLGLGRRARRATFSELAGCQRGPA